MSRKRYGYGQFMLEAMDRAEQAGQEPTTPERWERMYRQEETLRRNIDREREQLQQENARLREALRSLARWNYITKCECDDMARVARAALEPKS